MLVQRRRRWTYIKTASLIYVSKAFTAHSLSMYCSLALHVFQAGQYLPSCPAKARPTQSAVSHTPWSRSEWILLYVAFCTIMAILRPKEARSRDCALLFFQMTSRVLYSAHYHGQQCTIQAFELFGALYMPSSMTNIRPDRDPNPVLAWDIGPALDRWRWHWPAITNNGICSLF